MKPSFFLGVAQAFINDKLIGGEEISPEGLVCMLKGLRGVNEHLADQTAAQALASDETARITKFKEVVQTYRNHPAEFAAALRDYAEKTREELQS